MAHGLKKALVATAITAATLPALAQQDVGGEYESGTEVSGDINMTSSENVHAGAQNEVGANTGNTNEVTNYAMQYQHRTDDGQPLYSLQYDHLLKGPSCTETSRGMECNADAYMNDRPADAPIYSDVPISSVIATLSTSRGPMLTHIEASDIQSGFAKAAELIYADTFIHDVKLSFLKNGELVESAVCESNTYNPTKAPLEYDPAARTADKIKCSWSGPSLD